MTQSRQPSPEIESQIQKLIHMAKVEKIHLEVRIGLCDCNKIDLDDKDLNRCSKCNKPIK